LLLYFACHRTKQPWVQHSVFYYREIPVSEPFAISWGGPYPELCPFVSWRTDLKASSLEEELARPETSLCLFYAQYSDIPAMAAQGRLKALDEVFPAAELARNPVWLLDLFRVEGKLLALPEDITPAAVLVQCDLLARHGLKPAPDWATFLEHAQFLRRRLRQPGVLLPKANTSTFSILIGALLSSNGVNPMEDLRTLLKNPQPLRETYRLMFALRKCVAGLPDRAQQPQGSGDSLVSSGAAPYLLCYPSQLRDWSSERLRHVRAFPVPRGPSLGGQPAFRVLIKGTAWCIPRNTRAPETGVKALRILRKTSVVKKFELIGGHPFSALCELWDDPQVRRHMPLYRDAKRFFSDAHPPIVFQVRTLAKFGATMKASFEADESDDGWLQRLYGEVSGEGGRAPKHEAVRSAVRLIERNPEQFRDITSLAKSVGLSVTHLERLFRSEVRLSCGKYLRKRRMEYARELLVNSSQPIKEIAYRLGYAHPTHFSRDVKRHWKKSPAELRVNGGVVS
jgi:AraC-like DNA-binding protein